jgi:uncharacterized repeat protein (TIGR01451 family)
MNTSKFWSLTLRLTILTLLTALIMIAAPDESLAQGPLPQVIYRVNAGGPQVAATDAGPVWTADQAPPGTPSAYVNFAQIGNEMSTIPGGTAINITHPSITGSGAPEALFRTHRFDYSGTSATRPTAAEMMWSFPVTAGNTYTVRLYFLENFHNAANLRRFDVQIEGTTVLDGYDIFTAAGGRYRGIVETFANITPADNVLNIEFLHDIDNPSIRGLEVILTATPTAGLTVNPGALTFPQTTAGATSPAQTVTLTNTGTGGAPTITINSVAMAGTNPTEFTTDFVNPINIAPGTSATINVTFAPQSAGGKSATLQINHSGSITASPSTVTLAGSSVSAGFSTGLQVMPTAISFGQVGLGPQAAQTLTLMHGGTAGDPDITVSAITLTGVNAAEFSHSFTVPITLVAGQTTQITVSFNPTTEGAKTAALEIAHNGPNASPQIVALSGTGFTQPAAPPAQQTQPQVVAPVGQRSAVSGLTISKTVNPPFALPGASVTWTVSIANNSGANVDNLTVTDTLPDQLRLVSATSSAGTVSTSGQTVSVNLGTLGSGQNVTITIASAIREEVQPPYVITNSACLSTGQCAQAQVISINTLPSTGESRWSQWRGPIFIGGLALILVLSALVDGFFRLVLRR